MPTLSGTHFAAVSALNAAALLILFSAVFVVGNARQRHRYVDAVWGSAFALIALLTGALSTGHGDDWRRWLLTACTVIWGVRLSAHIARRGRGTPEDPRYAAMLAKAGGHPVWAAFTRVYLLQAALVWFISLPVQVGLTAGGRSAAGIATAALGTALWLVGFGFEAVGDAQLARFKADPAHRGQLMTTGLWRYTRHPNYFGDACVWWGLFLIAAGTGRGLLTVFSPILMTWLLTAGSGKPLVEKHLSATRPGYADYASRTSSFLPRRPRCGSSV
jgi:steroid 5-alpha reductase family enzyme